jgi:hypothetical protein
MTSRGFRGVALVAWGALSIVIATKSASARGGPAVKGTVVGTVATEKGKPIDGAEITIASEGSKPVSAKSNAKGEFVVPGVTAGDATVKVRARGYFAFEESIVVAGKGNTTVTAVLQLGVLFSGVVRDERGNPVEGAVVTAVRTFEADEFPDFDEAERPPVRSDAEGRYTVDDLPVAKNYALDFRHPKFVLGKLEKLSGKGGAPKDGLDVTLKDAAWVTGSVVDGAGRPVAGARIFDTTTEHDVVAPKSVYDLEQEKKRTAAVSRIFGSSSAAPVVKTDADGKFVFGGIERDADTILIDADGYFVGKIPLTDLTPGQEKGGVQAVLEPTVSALEGWLLDPAGQPVRFGRVRLRTAEGDEAAGGSADDGGHFVFQKIRAKAPVTLVATGYRVVSVTLEGVKLDQKALRVKMSASPRVKVKVLDSAGSSIREVYVRIETAGSDTEHSSDSGWHEQDATGLELDVPVGDVTLRFAAKGTAWKTAGPVATKGGKVYPLADVVLSAKGG